MSQSNKKQSSEDVMASLMEELKLVDENTSSDELKLESSDSDAISLDEFEDRTDFGLLDLNFGLPDAQPVTQSQAQTVDAEENNLFEIKLEKTTIGRNEVVVEKSYPELVLSEPSESVQAHKVEENNFEVNSEKTVALSSSQSTSAGYTEGDRTVAVAGYSNRSHQNQDENVKISVGQSGGGSAYGGWGSTDSNLAQAENLKIAQNKILELEKDNEKLRHQNEELVSASEIIRERSDLLTAQVYEYKNDREALESSFKNEMALLKSQLNRKDAELQKAQMKIDELDSRLKFDMKKIRIRERELENRLELMRAEKNALVRSKDEQILDSRRKIDQLQLEVDSFRQKCVELNRTLEANQDSFKRTNRALRLAMANLELQEENKTPLKKVD